MREIFFFDSMVTPKIINFVYWIALLGVVVGGIGMMFGPFGNFFTGLLIIIGGALLVRIYCELLIVLFKIHDNLKKIADSK